LIEIQSVDAHVASLYRAETARVGGRIKADALAADGHAEGIRGLGDGVLAAALGVRGRCGSRQGDQRPGPERRARVPICWHRELQPAGGERGQRALILWHVPPGRSLYESGDASLK